MISQKVSDNVHAPSGNLALNVVQRIPNDANIDLNNDHEVLLAMLEAARINAPVNNVNVILTEEKSMTINAKGIELATLATIIIMI